MPDVDYIDRRFVPWIVGAALSWSLNQLLEPAAVLDDAELGTGAWLAFGGVVVMVIGAVLSLSKVSFAVAVEGRDRRQRVRRGRPPAAADRDRRARRALEHLAAATRPARGRREELMPPVGEVSFELERFEWTADDRLEVVGRWNGVRGRRIARPALTVDAGGRRQRVSGSQISESDEPWRASFDWIRRGDIAGRGARDRPHARRRAAPAAPAPPPQRASAESDLRAQVDELRATVAELRAERDRRAATLEARHEGRQLPPSATAWRPSSRRAAATKAPS